MSEPDDRTPAERKFDAIHDNHDFRRAAEEVLSIPVTPEMKTAYALGSALGALNSMVRQLEQPGMSILQLRAVAQIGRAALNRLAAMLPRDEESRK